MYDHVLFILLQAVFFLASLITAAGFVLITLRGTRRRKHTSACRQPRQAFGPAPVPECPDTAARKRTLKRHWLSVVALLNCASSLVFSIDPYSIHQFYPVRLSLFCCVFDLSSAVVCSTFITRMTMKAMSSHAASMGAPAQALVLRYPYTTSTVIRLNPMACRQFFILPLVPYPSHRFCVCLPVLYAASLSFF